MPAHTRATRPKPPRQRLAACRAARSPRDVRGGKNTAAEDAHDHTGLGGYDLCGAIADTSGRERAW